MKLQQNTMESTLVEKVELLIRFRYPENSPDNERAAQGIIAECKRDLKTMKPLELLDFQSKLENALLDPERFAVAAWGNGAHDNC